jgi:polar amino acid transport system permease protein
MFDIGRLSELAWATLRTVEITTFAFIIALLAGVPLAWLRRRRRGTFEAPSRLLMLMLRGAPELISLYLIYYGLNGVGVKVAPMFAACLTLGLIQGAFVAEIYLAGLLTVPKGQWEAAAAIGLQQWQQWRLVIVPEALRFCLSPLLNVYLGLLKLSVVASAIGVGELLFQAQQVMNETFQILPIMSVVVAIFLAITLPLTWCARRIEARMRVSQAR